MDKKKLVILALLSAIPGILEALRELGVISASIAATIATVIVAIAGFLKPPTKPSTPLEDPIADLERSKSDREVN